MILCSYKCRGCKDVFEADKDDMSASRCPECGALVDRCFVKPPALGRLHKGPTGKYEPCFDRPNPEKDILHTAKVMEEGGKLTPNMEKMIRTKLKKLRSKPPPPPVDYGKEGHPAIDY